MSSSINTNAMALARQQYQTRSSLALSESLQKLSQGNREGTTDNAARYTISDKLEAVNSRIGPAYTVSLSTDDYTWAAKSRIRDTDFAKSQNNLTREQLLAQPGISILSAANHTPQSLISVLV